MIAELIDPLWDSDQLCRFAWKWRISLELARRLVAMAKSWAQPLSIVSGYRTPEEQADLETEGRPTAPYELSTHGACPATGADLRITFEATDHVKALFGQSVVWAGMRWGGGSPVNDAGIPLDWNHVDLGPRSDAIAEEYRRTHP